MVRRLTGAMMGLGLRVEGLGAEARLIRVPTEWMTPSCSSVRQPKRAGQAGAVVQRLAELVRPQVST